MRWPPRAALAVLAVGFVAQPWTLTRAARPDGLVVPLRTRSDPTTGGWPGQGPGAFERNSANGEASPLEARRKDGLQRQIEGDALHGLVGAATKLSERLVGKGSREPTPAEQEFAKAVRELTAASDRADEQKATARRRPPTSASADGS